MTAHIGALPLEELLYAMPALLAFPGWRVARLAISGRSGSASPP
ncbi:MAG TPA: hypothetical protein VD931_06290 [Baekduia sp.]|nr:hypothetical protein [Baekduia sp.]